MRYKRILISGKVQGVGFREFLIKEASSMGGLAGYAKNLKDGSIEVIVKGDESKFQKLLEKCRKGPLLSSVKNVIVEEADIDEDYDTFIVRL